MSFFHTFIVYISSALPSSPACWFLFYFGVRCLIVAAISLPSSQCGRTILSISWTGSVLTVPYHTSFLAFACCSQLFAGQSFLFFPFSFCFVSSLFLFSINSHCYNPCYLQQRTAYLLSATCSVGHFPAKKRRTQIKLPLFSAGFYFRLVLSSVDNQSLCLSLVIDSLSFITTPPTAPLPADCQLKCSLPLFLVSSRHFFKEVDWLSEWIPSSIIDGISISGSSNSCGVHSKIDHSGLNCQRRQGRGGMEWWTGLQKKKKKKSAPKQKIRHRNKNSRSVFGGGGRNHRNQNNSNSNSDECCHHCPGQVKLTRCFAEGKTRERLGRSRHVTTTTTTAAGYYYYFSCCCCCGSFVVRTVSD